MKVFALTAVLVVFASVLISRRKPPDAKSATRSGAPQLEVDDSFVRPDGQEWPHPSRSIVIATSSSCAACSTNQTFEQEVAAGAKANGIPVFYLISRAQAQDSFVRELESGQHKVIRADLASIGVNRTPTIMAVNPTGQILAIRIGSVFAASPQKRQYAAELLFGTGKPLYGRITSAELQRHIVGTSDYQIIKLRDVATPLPKGLRYRFIPLGELSVRANHEISKESPVFVDCNTATSPFTCQNALLLLSNTWAPDRLFAVDLPARTSGLHMGER
jgi:hypothetical protein